MDTDPDGQWIFIVDQLNTHQSASLVERIAERCKIKEDLGKKGKEGILESMNSRKQFLEDKSHRIRFVYTPKHASWLNQVEIWFSILTRRLIKTWKLFINRKASSKNTQFHRVFQQNHGKTFQVDIHRAPASSLKEEGDVFAGCCSSCQRPQLGHHGLRQQQ